MINEFRSLCPYSMCFEFYGVKTKVNVVSKKDLLLLEFQYKTFVVDYIDFINIEYFFVTETEVGFFEAIFDKIKNLEKTILYSKNETGIIHHYCTFQDWSQKKTPFPPFIFEPLSSTYLYLQGSSAVINGQAYSFLGKYYNGKSTVVNWVLRHIENSNYLSDDVTILDLNNFEVEPFPTATGIREDSKSWFNQVENTESKIKTISEITGVVEYFRIENLYNKSIGRKTPLGAIFILENEDDFKSKFNFEKVTSNKTLEILKYRLNINANTLQHEQLSTIPLYRVSYNVNKVLKEDFINELKQIIISEHHQRPN